jgi:uncharacterized membrane protein HdeD (DUF308 family)
MKNGGLFMLIKFESWKLLLVSVCYIIFGIATFAIEEMKLLNFCTALGIIIMVYGALQAAIYFFRRDFQDMHNFNFSIGVGFAIFGLFIWMRPQVVVSAYPQILAGCVLVDSMIKLQYAMNLLRMKDARWQLQLGLAVMTTALAAGLLVLPLKDATQNYLSILLILDGVVNLYSMYYYRHQIKHYDETEIITVEETGEK